MDVRRPPFWRYNLAARQILFSGYHLGPKTFQVYAEELRRRKPPWLHGYPSILAMLAQWMIEASFELGYRVRWITTGAENLMPHQVRTIASAFAVVPREHYGLAEAVANASMCVDGSLHVDEDFAAVELLQRDGATVSILGTNFTNPATPLLRYDTGDIASMNPVGCGCGLPGRALVSIDGRCEDYVVAPDGTQIGRLDHVFKDMVNVREAQIRQRRPDAIDVHVIRSEKYSDDDESRLMVELQRRLPSEMKISIEYPAELVRTASGKLRFVVSDVGRNRPVDRSGT